MQAPFEDQGWILLHPRRAHELLVQIQKLLLLLLGVLDLLLVHRAPPIHLDNLLR